MLGDYAPLFQILDSDEHTARRKALSSTVRRVSSITHYMDY